MWRGTVQLCGVSVGAVANVLVLVRKWVVFLVMVMTMYLVLVLLLMFAVCMDKMLSVSVAKVGGAAVRAVTFAAGGPAVRRWCDLQQDLPFTRILLMIVAHWLPSPIPERQTC